jgi:hypothetical protein
MNQNRYFLSKVYLLLQLVNIFFSSCNNKNDKGVYQHTSVMCKGLYLEVYNTFGSGALGGDMICHYLTDSINFRVRVGFFDNANSHYSYKCNEDSITIDKSYQSDTSKVFSIIETNQYQIINLKKLRNVSKFAIVDISSYTTSAD